MLTFLRSPRRFNWLCYALAMGWLAVVVPYTLGPPTPPGVCSLMGSLGTGDFPQFYMGGRIARLHLWDSLYPIPNPDSVNNPGMPEDSTMRPRYAEEAYKCGVDDRTRFIQLPPVALLLMPLAFTSYHRAFQLWTAGLIVCGWALGYLCARIYQTLEPRPSRVPGVLALLVSCSPIVLHSIRVANMTVPVGVCIGLTTLELARRKPVVAGLAGVLGCVTKYATLPLLPLAICMRRWAALAWAMGFTAALFATTYAVAGPGPFRTYARDISPTLSRTHELDTNQSLTAFVTRVGHHRGAWGQARTMPPSLRSIISVAGLATFGAILLVMFRKPRCAWDEPANTYAAATALVGTLLIFAPIFWEHYAVYLCPLWGWMLWEGWRSKAKLPLAVLGIGLMYVPWTYIMDWREPFNTHMLPGVAMLVVMGVWTLLDRGRESQVRQAREARMHAPGSR